MRSHTVLPSLLLCLLAPAAAALSLSEPDVRYRLGQPLTLRVDVSSNANAGEPARVRMAAPADFAKLGLEYPVDAGGFSVEETVLPDQARRFTLRARRLLREPIVFLLLDVQEGNTRLFKEVAAVLDGPGQDTGEAPAMATEPPPGVAAAPELPDLPERPLPGERRSQPSMAYFSGLPALGSRESPSPTRPAAPPRPSMRLRPETPPATASSTPWTALQRFQLSSRLDSLRVLPDALRPAAPAAALASAAQAGRSPPAANAASPANTQAEAGAQDEGGQEVDHETGAALEAEAGFEAEAAAASLPAPTHEGIARSTWILLGLLVGVAVGLFLYARRLRTAGMSELDLGSTG